MDTLDSADALEEIVSGVVEPMAAQVDREGVFPRAAVTALGEAGFLGLTSQAELGGGGKGLGEAAAVVERISQACGSTGMVMVMHYSAVALLSGYAPGDVLQAIASGRHLTTLAYSEVGSRSHFWVPLSSATADGDKVRLSARKSFATSAGEADSYVWSSRPMAVDGAMTLWYVPADTPGVEVAGGFDGLGLRGNASRPIRADNAAIPAEWMLGADGAGMDITMQTALPWFLVLNAAFSVGLMRAALATTIAHVTATRLEHLGQSLAEQPLTRFDIGRMQIEVDRGRALLADTIAALGSNRDDAMLRVLEVKAAAAEAAIAVTDLAMKVAGGAAFRKDLGLERQFRDSRAARVMSPTTDRLTDFVGRVVCGLPLLDGS